MAQTSCPPTFLDRLLDDAPDEARDHAASTWHDLNRYKQTLARDLELLLNSRNCLSELRDLDAYPAAKRSLLTYGVMDFTGLSLRNPDHQIRLKESIAEAIEHHEPRLGRIRVSLDGERSGSRMLHFRVDAVFELHPGRPALSFDAQFQVATGSCQVKH